MTKTNVEKIIEKRAQLSILEGLLSKLNEMQEERTQRYDVVGVTDEQDKDWHGNLRWEDEEHTIPKMKKKWDYVDIPEEELTAEQKAELKAIENIRTLLEKMI